METSDEDIFDSAPFFYNGENDHQDDSMNLNEVPMKRNSFTSCSIEVSGVTLSWRDISVFVPNKTGTISSFCHKSKPHTNNKYTRVLNNISGVVRPGTLLAIMGASGAGKTTLLNALALRLPRTFVTDGQVAVNGYILGQEHLHDMACFVHQKDYFYETLTVREHLTFMAKLRLGSRFASEQIDVRIVDIIKQTGLGICENTRIGIPGTGKGLSGGERKRLAFAAEVIADPPLIFCDEPTSGLDFYMAKTVVEVLENMAARGKTILCSIHQPSSDVFSMFTEILLLSEGQVAFMGPIREAQRFFDSIGYVCPPMYNPADYYVHSLAVVPGKEESCLNKIKTVCDTYRASSYAAHMDHYIQDGLVNKNQCTLDDYMLYDKAKYRTSWWTQFRWLLWRGMIHSLRHPKALTARIFQKFVLGVMLSVMFTNVSRESMTMMDVMGVVFLFITENTFPSLYSSLEVFHSETTVMIREQSNGLYNSATFYLSKILTLIPPFIFEPVLFIAVTYWIIGLNPSTYSVLITMVVVILLSNTASACGCFFSALFVDLPTSMTALVPFDNVLMIIGGLFINVKTLPWYINWTQFISWFRYSNEALSIAQWHGYDNLNCNDNSSTPCYQTGDEVLQSFGFQSENLPNCLIALTCLYVGFHIFGCLALIRKTKMT